MSINKDGYKYLKKWAKNNREKWNQIQYNWRKKNPKKWKKIRDRYQEKNVEVLRLKSRAMYYKKRLDNKKFVDNQKKAIQSKIGRFNTMIKVKKYQIDVYGITHARVKEPWTEQEKEMLKTLNVTAREFASLTQRSYDSVKAMKKKLKLYK